MSVRTRWSRAISVLAAVLVLGACASEADPAAVSEALVAETTEPPVVGPAAVFGEADRLLTFTGSTIDGSQFEGAGLIGRDVAIWFWAPW